MKNLNIDNYIIYIYIYINYDKIYYNIYFMFSFETPTD